MEILKIKIEDILKFPFEKKDWIHTFGVYALIQLLNSLVIMFFFAAIFFAIILLAEGMELTYLLLLAIVLTLFFAIFFVVQIYLQGYLVEMVRNIKEKKKEIIPRHQDIASKMKLGIAQLVLWVGPTTILFIILTLTIIMIYFGSINIETGGLILIILGALTMVITIFLMMFTGILVLPAMLYIYLDTNSLAHAYSIGKIGPVIKNMWKYFLLIYGLNILGMTIISTIGQVPGIGFLVLTAGTTYLVFVLGFLTGKIFLELDKLKLSKQ